MTKSDDLIAANKVTQHPTQSDSVIVNVPVRIKKLAIDNDAIELYANNLHALNSKAARWTPTIPDPEWESLVDDGEGNMIPNPVARTNVANPILAIDAAVSFVQDRVAWDFEQLINRQAIIAARAAAEQQAAALI